MIYAIAWFHKKILRMLEACVFLLVCTGLLFAEETVAPGNDELFERLQLLAYEERIEAPDFSLPDMHEGTVTLSDLRGKAVFLNFWATWCLHCRAERTALQALYDAHKDDGFVVLAVSTDQGSIDKVREYMQTFELTFPTVHDSTGKTAGEYGVRGVPMTFFIDVQGKALGGVVGPREWDSEDLHALVKHLLSERVQGEDTSQSP